MYSKDVLIYGDEVLIREGAAARSPSEYPWVLTKEVWASVFSVRPDYTCVRLPGEIIRSSASLREFNTSKLVPIHFIVGPTQDIAYDPTKFMENLEKTRSYLTQSSNTLEALFSL